jgi:hypothetical protein
MLPSKLVLGLPARIPRPEAKHVPALVACNRPRPAPFAAGHKQDVEVLAAPGRAGRVARRERDVFQVPALGAEHHDAVGVEHGDPQVAVGAARSVRMCLYYVV